MKRQPLVMKDPIFGAGSAHTANAAITVGPSGLACGAELYLSRDGGATKAATSGVKSFTSTGASQNISLPVTMPSAAGYSYGVYLDITSGGSLLAGFQATENVIIPSVGTPVITWT
jgi:hypothetical protein